MGAVSESTQPAPAPAQPAASGGTGLDPKVVILLCWIFGPLSSIIFIATEKSDRRIKFHAWESLFWTIAMIAVSFVLIPILAVVTLGFGTCLYLITPLMFVVNIVAIVKAYNGEDWKLPVIGDLADKQANK